MGQMAEARAHTELAMRLNPGHVQTAEQLRRLNAAVGLPEDAGVL